MLKTSLVVGLLAIAQAQTPQTPPATSAAGQAKKPAILEVRVTDRAGAPLDAATVTAEGPLGRTGETDRSGSVTFKNVSAGTYRFRIERDKFIPLEKEVIVKGGTMATIDAALSAAPPPPEPPKPVAAPPPPAPKPATPTLAPGEPKALSVPDFIQTQTGPRTGNTESAIGCSGATAAKVIQVRGALPSHVHASADEMLYVLSGEATVKLGDKEYSVTSGWFIVVPRGMDHAVTQKGRNPVTLVAIVGGPTCAEQ
jgi:mannose-6-phosphate isomerase-like protein (cupin superfamily)